MMDLKRVYPKRNNRGSIRLHVVPFLLWALALAGVCGLFVRKTAKFETLGVVKAEKRQVAATCTGRLQSVKVGLFDTVKKGQLLAVINTVGDNEHIQEQLDTISAEIQYLMAQLVPTQDQMLTDQQQRENDKVATYRRFAADVEQMRLKALELRAEIEIDKVTLGDLELEMNVAKELLKEDAIAEYEVQKAQVAYDALAKKISETEILIKQAQTNVEHSDIRAKEYAKKQLHEPSVDNELEVIHKAIKVQEQEMEELVAMRQPLELYAPNDGVISQIHTMPGEVIMPGDEVFTIRTLGTGAIVAYASETQLDLLKKNNMQVEIRKDGIPIHVAKSKVIHVGPVIEEISTKLLRDQNVRQWGRPILISIPSNMEVVPGEMVGIRGL